MIIHFQLSNRFTRKTVKFLNLGAEIILQIIVLSILNVVSKIIEGYINIT